MKDIPAFPCETDRISWSEGGTGRVAGKDSHTGLTIRDYFATHASEEDIKGASYRWLEENRGASVCPRETARYRHADLMLAARSGKE